MRLASYVPGELIPLPLSGSIPELPHVEKLEIAGLRKSRNVACGRIQPRQGSVKSIGAPASVFAVIDVVPRIEASETHQGL
jgi:hypothetical protein